MSFGILFLFLFFWVMLVGILEMFVIRFEIPLLLGLFPLLLGFGAFGKIENDICCECLKCFYTLNSIRVIHCS